MKDKRAWLLAAVLGVALSGGAGAQQNPEEEAAPSEFTRLDSNGDGRLSPDEAAQMSPLDSHFYLADLDNDGVLDEVEFKAFEMLMETVDSPGSSI